MFTLITLLVLALIAGATFTVKKVLNKKKEAKEESERLKSVYTSEVLKSFKKCAKVKQPECIEDEEAITEQDFPTLVIKHLKVKKTGKSKYKKRFTDYKLIIRFI